MGRQRQPRPLPPVALRYVVRVSTSGRGIVGALHDWMHRRQTGIKQLSAIDVERFLDRPSRRPISESRRTSYRRGVLRYLEWLYAQGHLTWDPDELRRHPKRLPPHADEFLAWLSTTLRPSTCSGYATTLRRLQRWLRTSGVALETLDRSQVTRWLIDLAGRGLHPSTRRTGIMQVRTFLRWRSERELLRHDPDDLIRPSDLPKLPQYLPRPLPVAVDAELQRRLGRSSDPLHIGLLVMRRTGLRIGELIHLPPDCVYVDHAQRSSLKVPLGKLNSERLVPLDDETARLIGRLQCKGPRHRRWLLDRAKHAGSMYADLRRALTDIAAGLDTAAPITSHRLRHTYATSLLAGGMSLLGVMTLLGHRDHRMTLRYTAITQETVRDEYFRALERVATRYALPDVVTSNSAQPTAMLADLIRWLRAHASDHPRSTGLIKRLQRLRPLLERVVSEAER